MEEEHHEYENEVYEEQHEHVVLLFEVLQHNETRSFRS
jgi:hypothetical protein